MVDAKTIEDLAMSLFEERKPDIYKQKILPVYKGVKQVVTEYFAVSEAIGYGTRYKEDFNLDSLDVRKLVLTLEDELKQKIPDEEAAKMHSLYDTVLYFICKDTKNKKTGELMQKSVEAVKGIAKKVRKIVDDCIADENKKYRLATAFLEIEGLDRTKLRGALNDIIKDASITSSLSDGDPYGVIEYLAKKDIKL